MRPLASYSKQVVQLSLTIRRDAFAAVAFLRGGQGPRESCAPHAPYKIGCKLVVMAGVKLRHSLNHALCSAPYLLLRRKLT